MNGKTQELHSLFKTCLDILRNDTEHLIGDEALNELSHFLILKQAEKHIDNGSIDIYNLKIYKDGIKKYGNEKFLEYLEYIKFSKLVEYVKIPEKERKDIVEITGTNRTLKFCKSHSTKKVKFYDFNPDTEKKHFIKEVNINEIASKNYSLNYTEYNIEEEIKNEENIKWIELSTICNISYGNRIVKKNIESGEYDVYGGGDKTFTTNTYNRKGYNIVITRFALSKKCVRILNEKFYLNDSGLTISVKNNNAIDKYIGYYFSFNQYIIYNLARGTSQKNLDMDKFKTIKIPIPSVEKQDEIIKFLDTLFTNNYNLQNVVDYYETNDIFRLLLDEKYDAFHKLVEWQEQSIELSKQIEFYKKRQQTYIYLCNLDKSNLMKKLNELCYINPKTMKKEEYNEINYIDISSVKEGKLLEITKLTNNFPSRAKRIIKKDDILYSSVRPNLKSYVYVSNNIENGIASSGFAQIRVKDQNIILSKYLYYILTCDSIIEELINKAKGSHYPTVSFDDFENLIIKVPTIEKQQEILNYCEYNDTLISQLEKEIVNNKTQSQQFIANISQLQIKQEIILESPQKLKKIKKTKKTENIEHS